MIGKGNFDIVALIGKRRTGKTTLGRKLIEKSPHKKIILVDTFEHPDYSDFKTITTQELSRVKRGRVRVLYRSDADLDAVNEHSNNSLIVFEDCTKYIYGDLTSAIRGIVFDSKQKKNDVLLMYHGFSFIPPKILSNLNYITLFKIGENIDRYKSKIPNYEILLKAHKEIQASSNPYINKTFQVN